MLTNSLSKSSSSIFADLVIVQNSADELPDEDTSEDSFEPLDRATATKDVPTQWAVGLLVSSTEADLTTPSRQVEALSELQALRQAAYLGEQQKRRGCSIGKQVVSGQAMEVGAYYAEPLSPLKQRDVKALAELFQREDIYTIESDISQMLLRLFPEPCWEENPFEFLREFL